MPTEPKTPASGDHGEPNALLHDRLADELDALRKRLSDADARQRANMDTYRHVRHDSPDAHPDAVPDTPGIPE